MQGESTDVKALPSLFSIVDLEGRDLHSGWQCAPCSSLCCPRDLQGHNELPMPGESNTIHATAEPQAGETPIRRPRAVISTRISPSLYK